MRYSAKSDEARRTSPLALWRYAHDYLRAAQELCRQHRIPCADSQVPYHLVAQGIEFALAAFLLAKGATMTQLRAEVAHSLTKSLARCEAQGMPRVPDRWRAAIADIAQRHQDRQFVYLATSENEFPDIEPLIDAGVWVLDRIAPTVVEHFALHLADDDSLPADVFVRRLRADLSATSDVVRPRSHGNLDLPVDLHDPRHVASPRQRRIDG